MQILVWGPVALRELKGLPRIYPRQPLLGVPLSLRDRICSAWCGLLRDAVQSREPEYANLLLFHSAQLLLRLPPTLDDVAGATEPGPATGGEAASFEHAVRKAEYEGGKMQSIVRPSRERVVLAEKGARGQLVHALYVETASAAQATITRGREAASPPTAMALGDGAYGEPCSGARTLERAAYKGRSGPRKLRLLYCVGKFRPCPGRRQLRSLRLWLQRRSLMGRRRLCAARPGSTSARGAAAGRHGQAGDLQCNEPACISLAWPQWAPELVHSSYC